ncbi:MAG: low molecular weight phosphatase family protein [Alphaproteobacteria bacterium]
MTDGLPGSILFACNRNTIRSAMAEAIMKHLVGHRVYVDSAGVQLTDEQADPFAIAAMREIDMDMSAHRAKSFDDLSDDSVDLIIALTPQAQLRAVEFTQTIACDVEYWPLMDPGDVTGPREVQLEAYRELRDTLFEKIKARFPDPDRTI